MQRCDAGLSFWIVGSGAHENANAPHPLGRRLCARRERPRGRGAPGERDELAPPHSITSSAATSSLSGTATPSIRAVRVLMTSSNFDDWTTGRSAVLAPLRM